MKFMKPYKAAKDEVRAISIENGSTLKFVVCYRFFIAMREATSNDVLPKLF